jgi:hypothetical protein
VKLCRLRRQSKSTANRASLRHPPYWYSYFYKMALLQMRFTTFIIYLVRDTLSRPHTRRQILSATTYLKAQQQIDRWQDGMILSAEIRP